MKHLLTGFGLLLFSITIPFVSVFAYQSQELYNAEQSTFNPKYGGATSGEVFNTDEYQLEHSIFNPEYGGATSEEVFNPLFGTHNTVIRVRSSKVPHIETKEFRGKLRSVKRLIQSIRRDSSSIRLYPVRSSYRQRVTR